MAVSVTGLILCSAILCGLIWIILYHVKRLRMYKAAAKYPGPVAWPFLGNAYYFIGKNEDILNKIIKLMNTYPSPLRFWLGQRLFFAVYDAEEMKTVFLSPKTIEKEDLYKFARPWLGTGLFTAPASKWRVHRKLILPTFNQKILESFVEVFSAQSQIMVKNMEVEVDGEEFDIFNYISLCTLDIICETAMGVAVKAQTERNSRYVESAKRAFEVIFTRMFKIWLHPDIIFNHTQLGADQRTCVEYLHSLTNDVIQKKKQTFHPVNGKIANSEVVENQPNQRKAFLDLLMELSNNGTKFTDEELREEVDTMMIAGNDTTATVNCFALLMMANFPEIQDRVYQELYDIYGMDDPDDSPIKHEDLHRMEYLERVIKETLRLFPVGPILVRRVIDDLNIGTHTLPKGSSVVLGIFHVHRSEKYWPDPLKFDPDRFLPEEVAKRHPFAFTPFSAGPRNCLGLKYAMMAMKALLGTVLRRYIIKKDHMTPISEMKLKADVMLKPVEPIKFRIERRIPKIGCID
uniref:Cytochrome P450-12 n=1 Tax=Cephus cinctus TaxID=211228 RepID=A0A1W6L1D9_CEPCN|nr:cytochrome P450-12 [Cephus cinctus]